jgi:hypothetical protein
MGEEEESAVEVYEFVVSGENSCERCIGLAGTRWLEPPPPLHARCECEVRLVVTSEERPKDCNDTTWDIEHVDNGAVTYGPDGAASFEWGYRVTINCWDGATHEFETWVDMGLASDWPITDDLESEIEAYAWDKVYEEAEMVVAQVCQPCGDAVVE